MKRKTAICLSIGPACMFCCLLACLQASEQPVKSLANHLAESGIPTEPEVDVVEGWLKTIVDGQDAKAMSQAWFDSWIGTELPFSFRYDGKKFTGRDPGWRFEAGKPARQSDGETRDLTWRHADTGLKVVWRLRRFTNYPAVDSLLTFENTGGKDTPMIEQVENLDLKLKQTQSGEKKTFTVHGCHGGRCGEDDLMPFARTLTAATNGDKPTLSLLRQDYENLEIDKSVIRTPLVIGDRKFEHGLGTHSASRIRIESPKPIERITAWIGVDHNERTRGGAGSAIFLIGNERGRLYQSGILRGGEAPVKIDVDAHGATTLDLNVDDAGDGPACDHADWAEAAITLEGGQTHRLDDLAREDGASTQFGSQTMSSNQELPFFNIESAEGRGVLVGLGWSGNWRARFKAHGTQLECASGHADDAFPLTCRRKSARAARAHGVLERPAAARKQYAPPRAL